MSNWIKGSEIKAVDAERLPPDTVVLVEQARAGGEVYTQIGCVSLLLAAGVYFGHPYVSVFNVTVREAQRNVQRRGWVGEP